MNRPLLVGITGGIGSGKTTVCKIFAALGLPIYYADDRGKYLLSHNQKLRSEVTKSFGDECYFSDGTLNRGFLASTVFGDETKLAKLNSLVHPAVADDFETWITNQSSKIIIKEAALLIENESYKKLDFLISVLASEQIRVERVLLRDRHRSKKQVGDILANQVTDLERKKLSQMLINNDGKDLIIPQTLLCYQRLRELVLENEGKAI